MAEVIDGRAIARKLDEATRAEVDALVAAGKPRPGLAVILVGHDGASEVYVRRKMKGCEKVGINSFEHRLPAETSQDALLTLIARLNADPEVHGVLCQVPLPAHIDTRTVLGAIAPEKDVDGFHPVNVGRLSTGTGGIVPCTPLGVMMLLETVIDDFVGLDAVVIGKSNIVGKPVALMLLDRECTVTVTHIYTEDLPQIAAKADIIVAAAGAPELVKGKLGQARRSGDRRRHHPPPGRGRQGKAGRRRRVGRGPARQGGHPRARRRRPDDDRLPAAQHRPGGHSADQRRARGGRPFS